MKGGKTRFLVDFAIYLEFEHSLQGLATLKHTQVDSKFCVEQEEMGGEVAKPCTLPLNRG